MAQIHWEKPPEPLWHFRYGEAFPPKSDSRLGIPDLLNQGTMSIACSVPANFIGADDYPHLGACFVEKSRRFQSGLTRSNQCNVASGKSGEIFDLGAVITQWLGQARKLLWNHTERHVP